MKKNEQIEEMVKIICVKCKEGICLIDKCLCNGLCEELKAEELYNAGYRKIEDDCAVITKAELNQYKAQAVKDFAEKLKKKLFDFFQDNEELDGKISTGVLYVDIIGVRAEDGTIISLGIIDELLKE